MTTYAAPPFLYRQVARAAVSILQSFGAEVWARNSYASGDIVPFLSDIDLTAFMPESVPHRLSAIRGVHSTARLFFPLIGELNCYTPQNLKFVLSTLNPLELKRDPELVRRVKYDSSIPATPAQRFVFFSRMLDADLNNLKKNPEQRTLKWARHVEALGLPPLLQPLQTPLLLDAAEEILFSPLTQLPVGETLRELLKRNPRYTVRQLSNQDSRHSAAILLLFPVHWLKLALEDSKFPHATHIIRDLLKEEKDILLEQLYWECSLISVQHSPGSNNKTLRPHLNRVLTLARFLSKSAFQHLHAGLSDAGFSDLDNYAPAPTIDHISPSFCVRPWSESTVGKDGQIYPCPCHEVVTPPPHLETVKLAVTQGVAFPACHVCYKEEQLTNTSKRLRHNGSYFSRYGTPDLNSLQPSLLNLRLGNQCAGLCVKCSAGDSSAWAKFMGQPPLDTTCFRREDFWVHLRSQLKSIHTVLLRGGDTLSSPEHLDFLNCCIEARDSSHLTLVYITNGAVSPLPFVELWRHFKSVEIKVALDGINAQDSYLRFPIQWSVVQQTLSELEQTPPFIQASTIFDIHCLNFRSLPEIAAWFSNTQYKKINRGRAFLPIQHLSEPSWITLSNAPSRLKDWGLKFLASKNAARILESDSLALFQAVLKNSKTDGSIMKRIDALDSLRGTDFKKIFPESAKLLC